jgi:predicted PurR-regulated permease PerM
MKEYIFKPKKAKQYVLQKLPKKLMILAILVSFLCYSIINDFHERISNSVIIMILVILFITISLIIIIDVKKDINKLSNSYFEIENHSLLQYFADGEKISIDLLNIDRIITKKDEIIIKEFQRSYHLSNMINNSSKLFDEIKRIANNN